MKKRERERKSFTIDVLSHDVWTLFIGGSSKSLSFFSFIKGMYRREIFKRADVRQIGDLKWAVHSHKFRPLRGIAFVAELVGATMTVKE
jgi:hypothetical protein